MKLLQSIRSVNPTGGGVIETVKQFSRVLEAQGHEVTIASLDAPDDPWVTACPHPVAALGPARGTYGASPRLVPWLRRRANEFDAVIVNGLWQFHSYGTWRALRGTGRDYFVFPHGMLDPWFKRAYPLKHFKKWLYWPWAEYRVLRDARAVLFTCDQERQLARQSFWLYRARERVVSLGTARPEGDPTELRESFLRRFPHCRGRRLLLFLGRLHEKKGCDLLVRAFAQLRSRHSDLVLVMAGPEQQDATPWKAQAAEAGVADRVMWTGMLEGDLKWGALHASEAFVLPSHQENFGMAVVESLACGVPVLISREVNIWREVIADGAGLAEADTLEGTMALLRGWLEKTPEEQSAMRERAQACFERRFEIGRTTRRLCEALGEQRRASTAAPGEFVPAWLETSQRVQRVGGAR